MKAWVLVRSNKPVRIYLHQGRAEEDLALVNADRGSESYYELIEVELITGL